MITGKWLTSEVKAESVDMFSQDLFGEDRPPKPLEYLNEDEDPAVRCEDLEDETKILAELLEDHFPTSERVGQ